MTGEKPDRVKVRTTFRPDRELEVSVTEAEDLRRQGLLKEDQKAGQKATGTKGEKP